jgi:hypothetical protein
VCADDGHQHCGKHAHRQTRVLEGDGHGQDPSPQTGLQ